MATAKKASEEKVKPKKAAAKPADKVKKRLLQSLKPAQPPKKPSQPKLQNRERQSAIV